jgi:thymidylate kinase
VTTGRYLTIVGPDGVGKTTLRHGLLERLEPEVGVRSDRRGGPLVEMRKRAGERSGDAATASPAGRLLTTAKLFYLFADQWLRWLRDLRRWRAGGGWIILERGWWDLAVFPTRYRIIEPGRLHRWLGRLVPRPDLIVVLEADPATVVARKAELTSAEITRQSELWRSILPSWQPQLFLDSSRPLDLLVTQTLAAPEVSNETVDPTGDANG